MGNLNARQRGLPSFLELVTDGRSPDALSGSVQATINIEEFVNLGKRERVQQTGVAASTNGAVAFSQLVVPNAEAWLLYGFAVTTSTVATQRVSLQATARLQVGASQAPFPIGDKVEVLDTTLANVVVAGGFPMIWLPPGSDLACYVIDLNNGVPALSISAFADIVRARV